MNTINNLTLGILLIFTTIVLTSQVSHAKQRKGTFVATAYGDKVLVSNGEQRYIIDPSELDEASEGNVIRIAKTGIYLKMERTGEFKVLEKTPEEPFIVLEPQDEPGDQVMNEVDYELAVWDKSVEHIK